MFISHATLFTSNVSTDYIKEEFNRVYEGYWECSLVVIRPDGIIVYAMEWGWEDDSKHLSFSDQIHFELGNLSWEEQFFYPTEEVIPFPFW